MTQTKLLAQVTEAVLEMPPERTNRIYECRRKIRALVVDYGDDGLMALAMEGLTSAAQAEQEEVRERMSGIREMA